MFIDSLLGVIIQVKRPLNQSTPQHAYVATTKLTIADRERIRDYLAKPTHERRVEDLIPDEDDDQDVST